jgi:putative ABC transport system substrate-binding protein
MSMRRREFIIGLGAGAWPLAARAQKAESVRRVGTLQPGSRTAAENPESRWLDAFKKRLAELGWAEGRNIRFEERWAENPELLPVYASELARLAPDAIFVSGSPSLRAMRQATSDIPIVFSVVADPVSQGFVSSLARPGGNITGFANAEFGLSTKKLDLLKKLAPDVDRVAFLYEPSQRRQRPRPSAVIFDVQVSSPLPSMAALEESCRHCGHHLASAFDPFRISFDRQRSSNGKL